MSHKSALIGVLFPLPVTYTGWIIVGRFVALLHGDRKEIMFGGHAIPNGA